GPGVVGARRHVEAPDAPPRFGVVGVEKATHAVLRTGHADDDLVADDERRTRGAVAMPVIGHGRFPHHMPRLGAQSDDAPVKYGLEEAVTHHAEPGVHQTAADNQIGGELSAMAPDLAAA